MSQFTSEDHVLKVIASVKDCPDPEKAKKILDSVLQVIEERSRRGDSSLGSARFLAYQEMRDVSQRGDYVASGSSAIYSVQ